MATRFRKQIGTKGFKLNVGKKGVNSASLKIAKGITYNTKRGLTIGIPGTGLRYNFGKKKPKKALTPEEQEARKQQLIQDINASIERDKLWKEVNGGLVSKKALITAAILFALCATPIWPIGLLGGEAALVWLLIDLLIRWRRFNKYKKENNINGGIS